MHTHIYTHTLYIHTNTDTHRYTNIHIHTQSTQYSETQNNSYYSVFGGTGAYECLVNAGQVGLLTGLGCTLLIRWKWISPSIRKKDMEVAGT